MPETGHDHADSIDTPSVLSAAHFGALLQAIRNEGYTLVGPTVRDGAIIYDEIESTQDLPIGWTDEQEAGHYRLKRRDDFAYFGYVVGPQSWKKFLLPARRRLWSSVRREDGGFTIEPEPLPERRLAFIGVRACELAAIRTQDRVLMEGSFQDPYYRAARQGAFVVAVNCVSAAPTCFCASMNTGPKVSGGDLALTEVVSPERHYFLVSPQTARGQAVLQRVEHRAASDEEQDEALTHEARAVSQMRRKLDTEGLPELIAAAQGSAHWQRVAERCLACTNCTMVCPTCFCSTVEDTVDLSGQRAERHRKLDSCFNREFTYLHTGSVRESGAARYRQWLTHKLSTWHAQFDSSGCVGCGRCITWCPVGIDITEEAAALREAVDQS
ncbi:MAG: 4Fe-4S dicluster domain-containing protein [Myxococcales bacterium]|nr:4Fe-4S dicluster domain-containing protein [Myxococcales bacterium]MDD9967357.1 4Fe-4S dicluster domain-containing protein [Myxococcales bacterium]